VVGLVTHVDDDGRAAAGHLHLLRAVDVQVAEVRLQLVVRSLEVKQRLWRRGDGEERGVSKYACSARTGLEHGVRSRLPNRGISYPGIPHISPPKDARPAPVAEARRPIRRTIPGTQPSAAYPPFLPLRTARFRIRAALCTATPRVRRRDDDPGVRQMGYLAALGYCLHPPLRLPGPPPRAITLLRQMSYLLLLAFVFSVVFLRKRATLKVDDGRAPGLPRVLTCATTSSKGASAAPSSFTICERENTVGGRGVSAPQAGRGSMFLTRRLSMGFERTASVPWTR
jgi:hypothetical protein